MPKPKTQHKRIGLVLNTVPLYSETFFRSKIKGLRAGGFEVLLFVDAQEGNSGEGFGKVIVARSFSSRGLRFVGSLLGATCEMLFRHPKQSVRLYRLDKQDGIPLLQRLKHLLLQQHFFRYRLDWLHFGFGILATGRENIAEVLGARMGASFRGYDLYLSPLKHPDCYRRLFQKQVRYHVLAQEMKTTLQQEYAVPEAAIQVIPPAIDISFFSRETPIQRRTGVPVQITTIARLHWKKGLEYTLEALAELVHKGVDFQYTVIGDGEELERLRFATYQLGLIDRVCFTGKLSQAEIKTRLEQTDVYLQYSIQEGFCNAVLEAQAMQLLCIVSDAEGLTENVLDGVTGWVVPKRRPGELAECIQKVLTLPEKQRQGIQTAARERVVREFHLEQQRVAFVRFYES